jgi:hypothetical protein
MNIPLPVTKGVAYINKITVHDGKWFARIALYVGENKYKTLDLLMLKYAQRLGELCLEEEGVHIHESTWGGKQWFNVEIEHHPKYDGRLKGLTRVQTHQIEKW